MRARERPRNINLREASFFRAGLLFYPFCLRRPEGS